MLVLLLTSALTDCLRAATRAIVLRTMPTKRLNINKYDEIGTVCLHGVYCSGHVMFSEKLLVFPKISVNAVIVGATYFPVIKIELVR